MGLLSQLAQFLREEVHAGATLVAPLWAATGWFQSLSALARRRLLLSPADVEAVSFWRGNAGLERAPTLCAFDIPPRTRRATRLLSGPSAPGSRLDPGPAPSGETTP